MGRILAFRQDGGSGLHCIASHYATGRRASPTRWNKLSKDSITVGKAEADSTGLEVRKRGGGAQLSLAEKALFIAYFYY